jgi:H+/Cl- antiporter ClcA
LRRSTASAAFDSAIDWFWHTRQRNSAASTLALWLGPLLLLGFGLALLFRRLARRRRAGEVELSEAEHARAADLLEAGGDRKPR